MSSLFSIDDVEEEDLLESAAPVLKEETIIDKPPVKKPGEGSSLFTIDDISDDTFKDDDLFKDDDTFKTPSSAKTPQKSYASTIIDPLTGEPLSSTPRDDTELNHKNIGNIDTETLNAHGRKLLKRLKQEELDALNATANKLGYPTEWFLSVIGYESRGIATEANPTEGASAKGLIQFTDDTAKDLGYKTSKELVEKNPTFTKQLDEVEKYFRLRKTRGVKNFNDFMSAIFWPNGIGKPSIPLSKKAIEQNAPLGIKSTGDYWNLVRQGMKKDPDSILLKKESKPTETGTSSEDDRIVADMRNRLLGIITKSGTAAPEMPVESAKGNEAPITEQTQEEFVASLKPPEQPTEAERKSIEADLRKPTGTGDPKLDSLPIESTKVASNPNLHDQPKLEQGVMSDKEIDKLRKDTGIQELEKKKQSISDRVTALLGPDTQKEDAKAWYAKHKISPTDVYFIDSHSPNQGATMVYPKTFKDKIHALAKKDKDIIVSGLSGHLSSDIIFALSAASIVNDQKKIAELMKLKEALDIASEERSVDDNFLTNAFESLAGSFPAMLKGASIGLGFGAATVNPVVGKIAAGTYFAMQGQGDMYYDMRKSGVDHKTAMLWSAPAGMMYGAVEGMSVSTVLGMKQALTDKAVNAIKKKILGKAKQGLIKKALVHGTVTTAAGGTTETFQEVTQSAIQFLATEGAQQVSGISNKPLKEVANELSFRMWDVAKQTITPSLLMVLPGGIHQTGKQFKSEKTKQLLTEIAKVVNLTPEFIEKKIKAGEPIPQITEKRLNLEKKALMPKGTIIEIDGIRYTIDEYWENENKRDFVRITPVEKNKEGKSVEVFTINTEMVIDEVTSSPSPDKEVKEIMTGMLPLGQDGKPSSQEILKKEKPKTLEEITVTTKIGEVPILPAGYEFFGEEVEDPEKSVKTIQARPTEKTLMEYDKPKLLARYQDDLSRIQDMTSRFIHRDESSWTIDEQSAMNEQKILIKKITDLKNQMNPEDIPNPADPTFKDELDADEKKAREELAKSTQKDDVDLWKVLTTPEFHSAVNNIGLRTDDVDIDIDLELLNLQVQRLEEKAKKVKLTADDIKNTELSKLSKASYKAVINQLKSDPQSTISGLKHGIKQSLGETAAESSTETDLAGKPEETKTPILDSKTWGDDVQESFPNAVTSLSKNEVDPVYSVQGIDYKLLNLQLNKLEKIAKKRTITVEDLNETELINLESDTYQAIVGQLKANPNTAINGLRNGVEVALNKSDKKLDADKKLKEEEPPLPDKEPSEYEGVTQEELDEMHKEEKTEDGIFTSISNGTVYQDNDSGLLRGSEVQINENTNEVTGPIEIQQRSLYVAYHNTKTGITYLNMKDIARIWKEKLWITHKNKYLPDFPPDTFKNFQEFRTFIALHEMNHRFFSIAGNEGRIGGVNFLAEHVSNNMALRQMGKVAEADALYGSLPPMEILSSGYKTNWDDASKKMYTKYYNQAKKAKNNWINVPNPVAHHTVTGKDIRTSVFTRDGKPISNKDINRGKAILLKGKTPSKSVTINRDGWTSYQHAQSGTVIIDNFEVEQSFEEKIWTEWGLAENTFTKYEEWMQFISEVEFNKSDFPGLPPQDIFNLTLRSMGKGKQADAAFGALLNPDEIKNTKAYSKWDKENKTLYSNHYEGSLKNARTNQEITSSDIRRSPKKKGRRARVQKRFSPGTAIEQQQEGKTPDYEVRVIAAGKFTPELMEEGKRRGYTQEEMLGFLEAPDRINDTKNIIDAFPFQDERTNYEDTREQYFEENIEGVNFEDKPTMQAKVEEELEKDPDLDYEDINKASNSKKSKQVVKPSIKSSKKLAGHKTQRISVTEGISRDMRNNPEINRRIEQVKKLKDEQRILILKKNSVETTKSRRNKDLEAANASLETVIKEGSKEHKEILANPKSQKKFILEDSKEHERILKNVNSLNTEIIRLEDQQKELKAHIDELDAVIRANINKTKNTSVSIAQRLFSKFGGKKVPREIEKKGSTKIGGFRQKATIILPEMSTRMGQLYDGYVARINKLEMQITKEKLTSALKDQNAIDIMDAMTGLDIDTLKGIAEIRGVKNLDRFNEDNIVELQLKVVTEMQNLTPEEIEQLRLTDKVIGRIKKNIFDLRRKKDQILDDLNTVTESIDDFDDWQLNDLEAGFTEHIAKSAATVSEAYKTSIQQYQTLVTGLKAFGTEYLNDLGYEFKTNDKEKLITYFEDRLEDIHDEIKARNLPAAEFLKESQKAINESKKAVEDAKEAARIANEKKTAQRIGDLESFIESKVADMLKDIDKRILDAKMHIVEPEVQGELAVLIEHLQDEKIRIQNGLPADIKMSTENVNKYIDLTKKLASMKANVAIIPPSLKQMAYNEIRRVNQEVLELFRDESPNTVTLLINQNNEVNGFPIPAPKKILFRYNANKFIENFKKGSKEIMSDLKSMIPTSKRARAFELIGKDYQKIIGKTDVLLMATGINLEHIARNTNPLERSLLKYLVEGPTHKSYIQKENKETMLREFELTIKTLEQQNSAAEHKLKILDEKKVDLRVAIIEGIDKRTKELKKLRPEYAELQKIFASPERTAKINSFIGQIQTHHKLLFQYLKDNIENLSVEQIVHYMTHLWGEKIENINKTDIDNFKESMLVSGSMHHRKGPSTYLQGIREGIFPRLDDVTEIMDYNTNMTVQAIVNQSIINMLEGKNEGQSQFIVEDTPENRKVGYTPIESIGWVHSKIGGGLKIKQLEGKLIHPYAKPVLNAIFRNRYTNAWIRGFQFMHGLAKRSNLWGGLFHHLTLFETAIGTLDLKSPKQMAKNAAQLFNVNLLRKTIYDNVTRKTGAYHVLVKNWEEASDFVEHGGQLGSVADVYRDSMETLLEGFQKVGSFVGGSILKPFGAEKAGRIIGGAIPLAAKSLNRTMDSILWDFLHNQLKIQGYENLKRMGERTLLNNIAKDPNRKNKAMTDEEMSILKRVAAVQVNDTFGGQNSVAMMSDPRYMQIAQTLLLSPDWTISTARQAMSLVGLGDITHSELGKKLRKQYGKSFWKKAIIIYGGGLQLLNAIMRQRDDDDQWREKIRKADEAISRFQDEFGDIKGREERKEFREELEALKEKRKNLLLKKPKLDLTNPKRLIELSTFGNSIGNKWMIFFGRNQYGEEVYRGFGKQFKDVPEYLFDLKKDTNLQDVPGVPFRWPIPVPQLKKIGGKASPFVHAMSKVATGYSAGLFPDHKLLEARKIKTIAFTETLLSASRSGLPFSLSAALSDTKEWSFLDLMSPQKRGTYITGIKKALTKAYDDLERNRMKQPDKKPTKFAEALYKSRTNDIRRSAARNNIPLEAIYKEVFWRVGQRLKDPKNQNEIKKMHIEGKKPSNMHESKWLEKLETEKFKNEFLKEHFEQSAKNMDNYMRIIRGRLDDEHMPVSLNHGYEDEQELYKDFVDEYDDSDDEFNEDFDD